MISKRGTHIAALVITLLSSCGKQALYDKTHSFKDRVWEQDVKPNHRVEITDTNKVYNLSLTLRTTTDYKYNNLWVFLTTKLPDGSSERKPFQFRITNEDGSWVGNKTGTIVETELDFRNRRLPLLGTYEFTLEQGITQSAIDEVLDIGLKVEGATEN